MKMTSRVLLPMYTDHQSVTAETLDCRKIFHREPRPRSQPSSTPAQRAAASSCRLGCRALGLAGTEGTPVPTAVLAPRELRSSRRWGVCCQPAMASVVLPDKLYVGSAADASNDSWARDQQITHVVNCAPDEAVRALPPTPPPPPPPLPPPHNTHTRAHQHHTNTDTPRLSRTTWPSRAPLRRWIMVPCCNSRTCSRHRAASRGSTTARCSRCQPTRPS